MSELNPEIEQLVQRLEARPESIGEIARATGLKSSWAYALVRRRIPEPGYTKVQRLLAYLDQAEAADSGSHRQVAIGDG